ncbi:MAG: hypothetical protein M3Q45_12870, partial [Chloroflexota bacterium]|nr:hypothetical protein [Chloroflexota bacterium]
MKRGRVAQVTIAGLSGLLCALAGAGLLATAGGWALGVHSLWAFSFLIFVPFYLRIVMAIGVLIVWIGNTKQRTAEASNRLISERNWVESHARLAWLGIPLAGLSFWLLRERTLHGDAHFKLQLLATRTLQTDPYVWKEPLDSLLTYTATALLRPFSVPAQAVVASLSVLAGMIYVAAILYVAECLQRRFQKVQGGSRTVSIIALLAVGSSQLWFGHVENYSLATATSFAAVALAVGYLAGGIPLWPVGIVGGLSISFHPQAAFALPALLLLLQQGVWVHQLLALGLGGLLAPLLTLGGLMLLGVPLPSFAGGYAGDAQLFLTLSQSLAPAQLVDALNNLWLIAPLTPLWLVTGITALWQPVYRKDQTFRYLTAVAAGLLVYHFSFQNDLARPQDWDLFAIV